MWQDFAEGNIIQLFRRPSSAVHVQQILARVEANIGKPYIFLPQNCEHFASFAFTGKSESPSLQVLGFGSLILGVMWLASQ
jgi:hypothetical protein